MPSNFAAVCCAAQFRTRGIADGAAADNARLPAVCATG
jgi:hypothetical protein